MSFQTETTSSRVSPPRIHLPFGLSFHDSLLQTPHCASLLEPVNTARKQADGPRVGDGHQVLDGPVYRIPRKPVRSQIYDASPQLSDPRTPLFETTPNTALITKPRPSKSSEIKWLIPTATILLFLLGFLFAVGHHIYLTSLNGKAVGNQVWVGRYSLAMAFIVRASLGAVISIAFTQRLWYSLQGIKQGLSISSIDALFAVDELPWLLILGEVWRNALVLALIALAMWLMPLITLISPTALTVGSAVDASPNPNCSVPSLNMTAATSPPGGGHDFLLYMVDYEEINFSSSIISREVVDLTSQTGRQLSWPSPCGANCTYESTFVAPAWKCYQTNNTNDVRSPWFNEIEPPWFGGYGDGSNYTAMDMSEYMEYQNVYDAGYNTTTSQFWIGVTNRISLDVNPGTMTVKDFLDLHIYYCEFMETTYDVRVEYVNHQQTNTLLAYSHGSRIVVPPKSWKGQFDASADPLCIAATALYDPLVSLLQGSIDREPQYRSGIAPFNTSIALIPALVHSITEHHLDGTTQEIPLIPQLSIGPLLESLSHNISISLLSQPRLNIATTVTTTCTPFQTLPVWNYHLAPLVTAYSAAITAALAALLVGAHAMLAAGIARDKSFSSILRSTRARELDLLLASERDIALSPGTDVTKQRLRFAGDTDTTSFGLTSGAQEKRMSFRLVQHLDSSWSRVPGVTELEIQMEPGARNI